MITNKDARLLVENLRMIAKENDVEAQQRKDDLREAWRRHYEGRADAYRLAAKWLEELISDEKTTR